MNSKFVLTKEVIKSLFSGQDAKDAVLQYLGTRDIEGINKDFPNDAPIPTRVILSDGEFSNSFFVLNSILSSLVTDDQLSINSIIKMVKYHRLESHSQIFMIDELEILQKGDQIGQIGKPINLNSPLKNLPTPPQTPIKFPCNETAEITPRKLNFSIINSIESLYPYQHFNLKVKISKDPQLTNYENAKGKGQLLSAIFEDKTGRIKAIAYNENAIFYSKILQKNSIIMISNADVKAASKQYLSVDHSYELILNQKSTKLSVCDENLVLDKSYNFIDLKDISNTQAKFVDLIGICLKSETTKYFKNKLKEQSNKLQLFIIDQTMTIIKVTLWDKEASDLVDIKNNVLAISMGLIHTFNGEIGVNVGHGTVLKINPEISQTKELLEWFKESKFHPIIKNFINKKICTIGDILRLKLTGTVCCYATVFNFKGDCIYKSCGSCFKKLREDNDTFYCEKCEASVQTSNFSYCLPIGLLDDRLIKVKMFRSVAEKFLGTTASALAELREENNVKFLEVFKKNLNKRYKFELRISSSYFKDVEYPNYTVVSMEPIDYKERCLELMKQILEFKNSKLNSLPVNLI